MRQQPLLCNGAVNTPGQQYSYCVRFEVFTAVIMKNAVFWDVAPRRSCVSRHLGGAYRLHIQGRKTHERGISVSNWLQPALSIGHN
jgi:hypothetical protein